jgi:tetratricopeptide (TPR) repeat protein
MVGGLVLLVAAAIVGILSLIPGVLPSLGGGDQDRLTTVLSRTIETRGIDAAVAQYRMLRAQGFAPLRESEADTNTLGYAMLQKGRTQDAIKVFQLNIETHPESANLYDSLGEAYLTAGNRALAITNYEKAIALDPAKRSAAAALQDLTGRKRASYSSLSLFHIFNGLAGIVSGAAAMILRKGSRRHSWAGRVFVITMLSMSGSAASCRGWSRMGSPSTC